jgi:hypothetical protein
VGDPQLRTRMWALFADDDPHHGRPAGQVQPTRELGDHGALAYLSVGVVSVRRCRRGDPSQQPRGGVGRVKPTGYPSRRPRRYSRTAWGAARAVDPQRLVIGGLVCGVRRLVIRYRLAALIFSLRSFRAQQKWSEASAHASVKPFFWLKLQGYTDLKSVILIHDGAGPAVIASATFTTNGRSTDRLVDLIDVDIPLWETFTGVSRQRVVPPQGEIVLLRQSLEHLVGQDIDAETGLQIMEQIHEQRRGIQIGLEYEDIYTAFFPPIVRRYSYPLRAAGVDVRDLQGWDGMRVRFGGSCRKQLRPSVACLKSFSGLLW